MASVHPASLISIVELDRSNIEYDNLIQYLDDRNITYKFTPDYELSDCGTMDIPVPENRPEFITTFMIFFFHHFESENYYRVVIE